MFDLQPRVHFHEPDAVGAQTFGGVGDELDRACADIVDRFCRLHRRGAEYLARCRVHARCGGFLDHLLVTALQRTIAFEQMNDVAVGVAKHLHLNMARALDILFNQDMRIAERGGSLSLTRGERVGEISRSFDLAHPLAAATCDGLNEHGVADLSGAFLKKRWVLIIAYIARRHGHARLGHQCLGCILQAHRGDAARVRPDPDEASVDHGLRKFGVFREETIARMDSLGSAGLCRGDNLLTHQIALTRRRRPDMHCLVGFPHMQRLSISIRIDCNRANAHVARGTDNPASNLAPIGDEEGLNHLAHIRNTPKRGASSTGAFNAAAKANPSTSRVWAGSIMPSSHKREVA